MNSMDYRGLTTILFAFFEDNDEHLYRLNVFGRDYNLRLRNEVNRIRNRADEIIAQSMSCRQNMELFDWLRCQGVQIFWNNEVYGGTYEEYIRGIEQDTLDIRHIKLGENETVNSLLQRLNHDSRQYDNAIIMGHSEMPLYFASIVSESMFIIPGINRESVLVNQSFFGERYALMSCYMGDTEARTWDEEYFRSVFNVDLESIPGSMCHHVISASISYESLRLRTYTGQERLEEAARHLIIEEEPIDSEIYTPTNMFTDPFEDTSY